MSRVLCRRCGVKWAQHPTLHCRACDRALGTYAPQRHTTRSCRRCGEPAETRESLCARCWGVVAAELAALAEVPTPPPVVAPPRRERTVGHLTYWVVWDGSRR